MPFIGDTQHGILRSVDGDAYRGRKLVHRFFRCSNAMSNPLQATKFGLPFRYVPTYLAGYYKYKAGDKFTEGGNTVEGKRDICDIYAIMYETSESVSTLDGSNAFTSPNLVSMARIDNAKETDEWTYFKLPFTTLPGKFIDKEKLKDGKYKCCHRIHVKPGRRLFQRSNRKYFTD